MVIDVELRHERLKLAIRGMDEPIEVDGVLVYNILTPGSLTGGLTELDALCNFRHSQAFLCNLDVNDIALRVL